MAPRNTRVTPDTQVRSPARSFTQSLDNFYAPARDTRSEQAMQQGLGAFADIAGQMAAEDQKQRHDGLYQQGATDAMREQAGQEMVGVKTGSIFRQNSKYYMAGLNETRGKAAASKFRSDLTLAYSEWDGRNVDDNGAGFRDWMNGRVGEFLGSLGDNQYMLNGALPVVNEVANNFAVQHTALTNSRLQDETWTAYDTIVAGKFEQYTSGEIDMAQLTDQLKSEADDMYAAEGAAANDHLVASAISYANTHNNPDALLALAQAHDDGKIVLSPANQERIANGMDAVEADLSRMASTNNARLTAEDKAKNAATVAAYAAQLAADPFAKLPKFEDVGDYTTMTQLNTLQGIYQSAASNVNPQISNADRGNFEIELFNAGTPQEKIKLLRDYTSAHPEAMGAGDVSKYMQSILSAGDAGSLINNATVKQYRDGYGKLLGSFQIDNYDPNTVSILSTKGVLYYNDYLMSKTGSFDPNDLAALRGVIDEAQAYSNAQLLAEFPKLVQDRAASSPDNSLAVGMDATLADAQAANDAANAKIFADLANGTPPVDPAATPKVDPAATPQATQDPQTPEQQTRVEAKQAAVVAEAKQQTFYSKILTRFSDGVIERNIRTTAAKVIKDDPEFGAGVDRLASKYRISPDALLAVMHFETGGTFSPSVPNTAGSGATGIIQFMPDTAKSLGTTTEALSGMTRVQQLVYVEKYFDQYQSILKGSNVNDIYMAVLWPKAIGKPDDYVLFGKGTSSYSQNKGLDTNGDGQVTKFEAAAKVRQIYYG